MKAGDRCEVWLGSPETVPGWYPATYAGCERAGQVFDVDGKGQRIVAGANDVRRMPWGHAPLPPDLARLCEPEVVDWQPYPCATCGAPIVRPHPATACVDRLRERVRELEALLADARARRVEETEGNG